MILGSLGCFRMDLQQIRGTPVTEEVKEQTVSITLLE